MGLSPMMQRYFELKQRYQDCLVFFRLGDFYEMFFDDARIASKELQLALTGRDCGLSERAPMCGVPHHSVNTYINKLLEKNYKVAICEQLSDPKLAKGKTLVERDVVRVVTPGTIIEDDMLSGSTNNFLASVCILKNKAGIAWADVSTGEFFVSELTIEAGLHNVCDRLLKINPREIIVDTEFLNSSTVIPKHVIKQLAPLSCVDTIFSDEQIVPRLFDRFSSSQKQLKKYAACSKAAAGLWEYLLSTQKNTLSHMNEPLFIQAQDYLFLDSTAVRNLELFKSNGDHGTRGTLFWLLNQTQTPMGYRRLQEWLERPLRDKNQIEFRLDAVEQIKENYSLREDLKEALDNICDIERISSHIAYGNVSPRETVFVRRAIKNLPKIKELLKDNKSQLLALSSDSIDTLSDIYTLLDDAVCDDAPEKLGEGKIIRPGYNKELDDYRDAVKNGQNWILRIEAKEREETGIKNLKIKYNKIFGYTIEVTNSFKDKVPFNYIRRQTLAGCERYVTEELKRTEELVVGSEEKALKLELALFENIRNSLLDALIRLRRTAEALSVIDAVFSLGTVAFENSYSRPSINCEGALDIKDGRHPVVEKMQNDSAFVPNDTS